MPVTMQEYVNFDIIPVAAAPYHGYGIVLMDLVIVKEGEEEDSCLLCSWSMWRSNVGVSELRHSTPTSSVRCVLMDRPPPFLYY
jgi:hypothetical protein